MGDDEKTVNDVLPVNTEGITVNSPYGASGSDSDPEKAYKYVDTTNGNLIMNGGYE